MIANRRISTLAILVSPLESKPQPTIADGVSRCLSDLSDFGREFSKTGHRMIKAGALRGFRPAAARTMCRTYVNAISNLANGAFF